MNAYPLQQLIPWKNLTAYETIKLAHAMGAVIQWNHPGFPAEDWQLLNMKTGLRDLGADAWEHVPFDYDPWKKEGACPLLVGTSDTHSGTFSDGECTLVLAATPQADDVAEAIRWKRAVAVVPSYAKLFYGPDPMVARAWDALAEGKALKEAKAERLKAALKDADLVRLLRIAPSKPAPAKK